MPIYTGAPPGYYAGAATAPSAYSGDGGAGFHTVPIAGGGYGDGTAPPPQPSPGLSAADQPVVDPGVKDVWASVLFWAHVLTIVIIAFATGVPAMQRDAAAGDTSDRPALDFNASLFVRMIALGMCVSGVVAAAFFQVLRRAGGALIKVALYSALVMEVLTACVLFAVAPVAGVFMLLLALATAFYIYLVRNRIPFAAAHLTVACDAVTAHASTLFATAVGLLAVQALWIFFWAAASLGVAAKLNADAPSSSGRNGGGSGSAGGGVIVFFLLVSLYWGAQVRALATDRAARRRPRHTHHPANPPAGLQEHRAFRDGGHGRQLVVLGHAHRRRARRAAPLLHLQLWHHRLWLPHHRGGVGAGGHGPQRGAARGVSSQRGGGDGGGLCPVPAGHAAQRG